MAPSSDSGHDHTLPASSVASVADAEVNLKPGTQVGEYEILGKIGEGGFGTVYEAVHPLIGKKAAVKVLSREFSANPEMVSRFVAEARAANTIRHKNIIDIFNFSRLDDGRHYFVMELLDGASFDSFLEEKGALEPQLVLTIMRSVSRALDAAHAKGIVHRDLKPDNIYLTFDEDGKPIPKLLDFGIAKLLGEAGAISGHKTRTGAPVGTPHYMAPEQCLGEEVNELVDVYAFGVVCFEALTGTPPFSGKSFLELMNKQTNAPRPAVSERNSALDEAFDEPIQRMMALEKSARPQSLAEAYQLLEAAATEAGFDADASVTLQPHDQRVGMSSVSANTAAPSSAPIRTIPGETSSSRSGLFLVAGVLVLGVGAYVLSGGMKPPAVPAVPSVPAKATATPSAKPVASTPPKVSAAAPIVDAPDAAAPTFTVAIAIKPANVKAKVFLVRGDEKAELAGADGKYVIEGVAGDEVSLLVSAVGYLDFKKEIELGAIDTVDATMRPRPRLNKDLEDPFQ